MTVTEATPLELDRRAADHAAFVSRLAQLVPHIPESDGERVSDPVVGDLAVVEYRGMRRFALVTRPAKAGKVQASLITQAGILTAYSRRASHVIGTPGDPTAPGYVRRFTNPDLYEQALFDAAAAHACVEVGAKWWTCWANIVNILVPSDDLRVVRD